LRSVQGEQTLRKAAASNTKTGRKSGVADSDAVAVAMHEGRRDPKLDRNASERLAQQRPPIGRSIKYFEERHFAIDAAIRTRYAYLIRSGLAALTAGVALAVSTAMSAHASSCSAALGEQVFEKCSACHSLVAGQHMMGPTLNGLNGRKAGTVDGFKFSVALRDSGIVWNDVTLNEFLKSPQSFIPGTVMPFGGIQNATERAALVCYLVSR